MGRELQSFKMSLLPDTDMLDTVDGHMLTTLASVKLIPMLIFSSQEEPQSPLLELSPPMLTELLYQLTPQLLLPPPLPILLPEEPQPSTSPEELQSFLLEDLPPTPMEPLSQLIPQLLLPQPLPILLPRELQSSKMSVSPMSDMLDTLDGHMVTTSESAKLTVMLTLDTDTDSDTESNTSQLLHLLEV